MSRHEPTSKDCGLPHSSPREATPESQAIASAYYYYAIKIANRYARSVPWFEDELVGEATMALLRASRAYDPSSSTKLATYIGFCVDRACWKLLSRGRHRGYMRRREHRRGGEPDVVSTSCRGDFDVPCPRSVDPPEAAISAEAKRLTREKYDAVLDVLDGRRESSLDDRERVVLRRMLVDGEIPRDIGRSLGIGRANIYKIRDSAMTKLRDRFRAA